ncbi:MAG: hypothetical protein ACK6BL_00510 [Holosporaceae bacterium]
MTTASLFPTFSFAPQYLDQVINPWSFWNNSLSQFGLININYTASRDPQMEKTIITNVASYGRQLGRIMDVLNLLIEKDLDKATLTPSQQEKLDSYTDMANKIASAKQGKPLDLSLQEAEEFIKKLSLLKTNQPETYGQIVAKLKAVA